MTPNRVDVCETGITLSGRSEAGRAATTPCCLLLPTVTKLNWLVNWSLSRVPRDAVVSPYPANQICFSSYHPGVHTPVNCQFHG